MNLVSHQYRLAHTDVSIPDFSSYRRPSNKDLSRRSAESTDDRRAFTYIVTAGVGVGGAVAAKHMVQGLLNMLSPARDCLALSKIEVNIGNIPEGKNVTVKWRGNLTRFPICIFIHEFSQVSLFSSDDERKKKSIRKERWTSINFAIQKPMRNVHPIQNGWLLLVFVLI